MPMQLFDSHCHLDDRSYENDLPLVVQRARTAGLKAMMIVGTGLESSGRAVRIANQYDGLYASVGVHPHDAKACTETMLNKLKELANNPKVKAWGETGLDFNRMYSPQATQEHWFLRQLEIGAELGLPMIFHERDTHGSLLNSLQAHWKPHHKAVVHCFSGTPSELEAYLAMGLYIGITGILTIKNRGRGLRDMVRKMPAERLVVETDAPYLTPTPERNKHRRNEPAFVRTVLLKLAHVRDEAPEELAATIWSNTCRLYGLPSESQ
jgi:TatD DNase family protein